MFHTTPLAVLAGEFEAAVTQATEALALSGLQVIRSFDLQVARAAHVNCTCPHHGTSQCDCQLVVLLVYQAEKQPVSLVIHGHDGETELALVTSPAQQSDTNLLNAIRAAVNQRKFLKSLIS